ncbi:MAG: DUF1353 domain-containing protein [Pseudomonadota bacterium]
MDRHDAKTPAMIERIVRSAERHPKGSKGAKGSKKSGGEAGSAREARDPAEPTSGLAVTETVCSALDDPADGFRGALAVLVIPGERRQGRRLGSVLRPFIYTQTTGRWRFAVLVPPDYETDFASIPWGVRWLIAPFGAHAEPAVVHDWLYSIGEPGSALERRLADRIFSRAMRSVGVNPVQRCLMFWTVRLFGRGAFGRSEELRFRDGVTLDPRPDVVGREIWRDYTFCRHRRA